MDDRKEKSGTTTTGGPHSSQQVRMKLDQFIQMLCSLAIVQQMLAMYNRVKHSNENMDQTFTRVEEGVRVAYSHSLDLYDQYCQATVDRVYNNVNGQTKRVLDILFTFGIGGLIIMAQLTLTVFVAIINMLFNAVASGRGALEHASTTAANAQTAARQMVSDISGKVQDISRASTEKVGQRANILLDQANRMASSTLGVAPETGGAEKKLSERLCDLGYRISESLKNRAHGDALISAYADMYGHIDRLSNSLSLLNIVRANKSWVVNKVGELQTSLADLKASLEKEAERLKEDPEEALMNYLRRNSTALSAQLRTLRESCERVLNEPAKQKLDAVASYLEELDKNLGEAHDVHEVKDEILKGAHDRLIDLVQWTTNRLTERQKRNEGSDEHKEEKVHDESHGDSTHAEDIKLD